MSSQARHTIKSLKYSNLILPLLLATLPLTAAALDLTPDASRVISDPAYLPSQGQLYGSTAYTYGSTHYDVDNYLGASRSSSHNEDNTINQVLEYGVTDDIILRVQDSYAWQRNTSDPAAAQGTTVDADGFIDPSFGGTWRVLDQKQFPVSWDLIGSYTPDWIDSKSATTTQTGTVARGGDEGVMGTALSYKTRDFTVYGEAYATYLGNRNTLNQASNITVNYDSSWQYALELETQTRLNDWFAVNLGVSEILNNNADASYVNARNVPIGFTSEPGDVTAFNASLNFQVIPNRLVAGLTYSNNLHNNSNTDYDTFPKLNSTTKNEDENIFGARLQYVFN